MINRRYYDLLLPKTLCPTDKHVKHRRSTMHGYEEESDDEDIPKFEYMKEVPRKMVKKGFDHSLLLILQRFFFSFRQVR